ncbi:uncharacterized protein H6S33_000432 [Morchella sextelata]|uniref:uncharacterized protein n=1 Tax=Morchella sextelata TaxID=1174677 RepID=UPI001D055CBD|nr:uncharacterized protein H6S33_000432 [Morchella sextelata]KAH0614796.1 hypothetical protein H6S33_000432 [Morchella sextelata]
MTTAPPPDASIDQTKSIEYWNSVEATPNGMLGGYEYVSRIDIQGSKNFLAKLRLKTASSPEIWKVADCGAGIGRITKELLTTLNKGKVVVDIIEPVEKFTKEAIEGNNLKEEREDGRVGKIVNVGLQQWDPVKATEEMGEKYYIIWNQWCVGHLSDVQLVAYLARCKNAVLEGGVIVVKENITETKDDMYDEIDSSITRTDHKFKNLFRQAGLRVVRTEIQKGFPTQLYQVRSYALRAV